MAAALLSTKLHAPAPRRARVPRPRLLEQLDRGGDATLTLVSAPAGFGKSTVLAQWLATRTGPARGWLSLDPHDDDPTVFWTYVAAAVGTAVPSAGEAARALLASPPWRVEEVVASLLEDLGRAGGHVVLVLDDYHVVADRGIHDGVAFLLDHLPLGVHVVVSTRADPPLPLARWRARGELVELRAADLRFTRSEAAAYLTDLMALPLSSADVAALEERTEGWAAALQLAGLSLQGRADVSGFVSRFAGDDRYVVDYLVEEVLLGQDEQVRDFLLRTSVLSRLTGGLCDAVTGTSGGRAMLQRLERANLFLVPLDDRREWYRYHHLFADVLRARLLDEHPALVPDLHLRASEWHEHHGQPADAIAHALAGTHTGRAADLVERAMPAAQRDRQEGVLRGWLEAFPERVLRARPLLGIGYAGALMQSGRPDGVDALLDEVERWLDAAPQQRRAAADAAGVDVTPEEATGGVRATVAMYRAGLALLRGDPAATVAQASRASQLARPEDLLQRGAAAALRGLAHWGSGDLEAAHRWYAEGSDHLAAAGHVADTLGCAIALADVRLAQGRLRDATRTYEQALTVASAHPGPVLRGTADMHVGIAACLLERDDLPGAEQHLRASETLGVAAGLPQNRYRSRVVSALLRQAHGDHDAAIALLDEAERLYVGDMFPEVRPVAAVRARAYLAAGRLEDAARWAAGRGLSAQDEPTYLHEYEYVTLAALLLAQATTRQDQRAVREVSAYLQRLLVAADGGGRGGTVLELLVLQALAHEAAGDAQAARAARGRARALAEPEGYVRVLGTAPGVPVPLLVPLPKVPAQRGLVEPLSERELHVLRLLASDLDGPGIARELVVSLNTLRTHTRHIYAKLGVNDRRGAVRRARELDLLAVR